MRGSWVAGYFGLIVGWFLGACWGDGGCGSRPTESWEDPSSALEDSGTFSPREKGKKTWDRGRIDGPHSGPYGE